MPKMRKKGSVELTGYTDDGLEPYRDEPFDPVEAESGEFHDEGYDPDKSTLHSPKSKRRGRSCCISSLLAMTVALVVLAYYRKLPTSFLTSTNGQSISQDFLLHLPSYTQEAIAKDSASPQANAFEWLKRHPDFNNTQIMPMWRKMQLMALSTLYYATDGNNSWHHEILWMQNDIHECDWIIYSHNRDKDAFFKVKPNCTNDGRYESLVFRSSDLQGTLPPEIALLSDSLLALGIEHMRTMSGSLPSEIATMTRLTSLRLNECAFNGTIPQELFASSRNKNTSKALTHLVLDSNSFTGNLPTTMGELTTLEEFLMNGNHCNGTIPTQVGSMSSLKRVGFGWNQFTGSLPSELGNLKTSLELLLTSSNQFIGTFPSELFELTQLTLLDGKQNTFTGSFPGSGLGQLTLLEDLHMHASGIGGALPMEIYKLSKMKRALLSNNHFTGTLPGRSLARLSSNLAHLDVGFNAFAGTLPMEMGFMAALTHLGLHSNMFIGLIPSELGLLTNLHSLQLYNNSLTGSLPQAICDIPGLTSLTIDCEKVLCRSTCVPCQCK